MPQKKKLLFVNGHMKVGGGEKSLLDLLQHIDYTKYYVDLLLIEGKGAYIDFIPSSVNVIYEDTTKAYGPFVSTIMRNIKQGKINTVVYRIIILLSALVGKKIFLLARYILHINHRYDCAIAYRPGMCADIIAYAARAKKKICWWHNGKCDYTANQRLEVESTWQDLDKIVSVSEGCKQLILENFSLASSKVVIIPNMIDVENIQTKAGVVNPYTDNAEIRIVTLCRLSPEKHLENVVYVMSHLEELKDKKLKWYIIGDGPERKHLHALVDNARLTDSIVFLGQLLNPYPYIKFANYYVNTSYQESQSLSVLEAMSLNVPCVVTKTIGTDGYCVSGENCILAEQSGESLTKCVSCIIRKKDNQMITRNAYNMVCSEFTPKTIIEKTNFIFS